VIKKIFWIFIGVLVGILNISAQKAVRHFRIAHAGYHWKFPRDEAAHPRYQTEWWYYTGHLKSTGNHHYGFEVTFFRESLRPLILNPSAFAISSLYFSHFAISNLIRHQFWYAQKMNRPGPGLAGSGIHHFWVRNGRWKIWGGYDHQYIRVETKQYSLFLKLKPLSQPVLQGNMGYSLKGKKRGQASLYYSFPWMRAIGILRHHQNKFKVHGMVWMDHEFFTEPKTSSEMGWDWFGLQFFNHASLMLYRMRLKNGGESLDSQGTWVSPKGTIVHLTSADIKMKILKTWKSLKTKGVYPIAWKIQIQRLNLILTVQAAFPDQELNTDKTTHVIYWEGAVNFTGVQSGRKISGDGYMELTGYAHAYSINNFF
jgi:predicted secreted hydrolase